jgi:hypothetical protein
LEQHSSWDVTETFPFGDRASPFVLGDGLAQDFLLIAVIELNIVEFCGVRLAMLTNFHQLFMTVWHLVNGHVGVCFHAPIGFLSGFTHLGESLLALSGSFVLFLLSKVFIDLLLALFLDELDFESIEESLLVSSHLLDLSKGSRVSNGRRIGIGELEVDANHVKLGALLLDELEEVLLLGLLEGLSVLQDNQLELNDGLELGHVGSTNIKIGLIHEL